MNNLLIQIPSYDNLLWRTFRLVEVHTQWVPYDIQKLSLREQLNRCFPEISTMVRKIRAKNWSNGWRRNEENQERGIQKHTECCIREAREGEFLKKRGLVDLWGAAQRSGGQKDRESISWSRRKFIGCLPQASSILLKVFRLLFQERKLRYLYS